MPSQEPIQIHRLSLPPAGQSLRGWCLYEDDRWDGPCPQESDEHGFLVYADEVSAYAALAREMKRRCSWFEERKLHGGALRCLWYPMRVTWFADGHLVDETNSEQFPPAR